MTLTNPWEAAVKDAIARVRNRLEDTRKAKLTSGNTLWDEHIYELKYCLRVLQDEAAAACNAEAEAAESMGRVVAGDLE